MTKPRAIAPQGDDLVSHRHATLNGRRFHYLFAEAKHRSPRATVFLIHGWPDISFGWRYQIPLLVELGLNVVAPDLLGFGGSDAPKSPPADLASYSLKQASDNIAELARQLGLKRIILGGHDWGGAIVYRCALWHPDLISHVFSVCTPYTPPNKHYISLAQIVKRQPQFGYQQHLAGPEVERSITTRSQIKGFLNGMYGGRTPDKIPFFSPQKGINFAALEAMGKSPLLSEVEIEYYTDEYMRNGLHGTLNWYRTTQVNYLEETKLPGFWTGNAGMIHVPVLFVQANRDNVLLPEMSKGMERYIPRLNKAEVNAGHWALWQAAGEVNEILEKWFEDVVFTEGGSRL